MNAITHSERDESDVLSQLDADISYLEGFIVPELRRRRNSRAPFLCLPSEIIGQIAVSLAEDWPPKVRRLQGPVLQLEPCWLYLARVCTFLRSLMLDHRQLWADDAFTVPNVGFSKMMISRARDFPLTAKLTQWHGRKERYQDCSSSPARLLREHILSVDRVYVSQGFKGRESWQFDGFSGLWPFTYDELSALHLPLLRSFSIDIALGLRAALTGLVQCRPAPRTLPHMCPGLSFDP